MSVQQSIGTLTEAVKELRRDTTELKKSPPPPRRMAMSEAKHTKQSLAMKAKWADPEIKARLLEARKKKVDGQDTSETSEKV